MTNAAKHADASVVVLHLAMRDALADADGVAQREIELVVEDDGRASDRAAKSGMGLLGMRERAASLGGRLSFQAGKEAESVLRVVVPIARCFSSDSYAGSVTIRSTDSAACPRSQSTASRTDRS